MAGPGSRARDLMRETIYLLLMEDNSKSPAEKMLAEAMRLRPDLPIIKISFAKGFKEVLAHLDTGGIDAILLSLNLSENKDKEILTKIHAHAPNKPIIIIAKESALPSVLPTERDLLGYFLTQKELNGPLLAHTLVNAIRLAEINGELQKIRHESIRNLAEFQAVNQASLHLTSTLELQPILDEILKNALSLVSADDAHIFLYDGECLEFGAALFDSEQQKEPFANPRRDGLTYTVAQQGEQIIINDVMEHSLFKDWQWGGAILGLPLKIGEEVQGVMNIAFKQPHTFSENELRVLQLLGDQAAIAIHNAWLYEQAQQEISERKQIEKSLRESEERYRKLFASSKDAIMTLEPPNWKFSSGNPAILEMFKVKDEREFSSLSPWDISPDKQPDGRPSAEKIKEMIQLALEEGSNFFEWTHKRLDREEFPATVLLTRVDLHKKSFLQATVRDITDRKGVENALRESEEKYRILFERIPIGLYRTTPNGEILDVNPAMVKMLKYPDRASLLRAKAHDLFVHLEDRLQESTLLEQDNSLQDFRMQMRCLDGTVIWVQDNSQIIRDHKGQILYYQGSLKDITERKSMEEAIKHMATHDSLTNLPNRRLFDERIALEMAHGRRNQQKLGVLLLDLDGFKEVNDTLGHNVGDQLLKIISERLLKILRESDTIARMGGDEFLVILPDINQKIDATKTVQRILEIIREPFEFNSHNINISTSIGITIFPNDGEDVDTLVKNADIAMYRAKGQGGNRYCYYEE